jgi:hypothetical protein
MVCVVSSWQPVVIVWEWGGGNSGRTLLCGREAENILIFIAQ